MRLLQEIVLRTPRQLHPQGHRIPTRLGAGPACGCHIEEVPCAKGLQMPRVADTVHGMILERFPELLKLSEDERIQLSEELSDTVFLDEPVTDPLIVAELERRMEEYRRDPSLGKPWSEVRARLRETFVRKQQ